MKVIERDDERLVHHVLDVRRSPQNVASVDHAPHYVCNRVGEPMRALPTLVAYERSNAYRDGKSGQIIDQHGQLTVPNSHERERITGYPAGCTAAPGVTESQRHGLTGRCMDAYCLETYLAVCMAIVWPPAQPYF